MLLGMNELFGLDEIVDTHPSRYHTVRCSVNNSTVMFIRRDDFVNCVNQYKFSEKLLQEKLLKSVVYSKRLTETQTFRKKK
mmetsp:Transcript_21276/g.20423  ORF Transcript_21276/g.20423 Transcript_21276/m.20423 type:complete len:81 (+) Transcript_21276:93-335(+)